MFVYYKADIIIISSNVIITCSRCDIATCS